MTRRKMSCLIGAWFFFATVILNLVWDNNLDYVPRPPESFSLWLIKIYGAVDNDDIADLEIVYGMSVSFFVVVTFTFFSLITWRIFRKGRTAGWRGKAKSETSNS